MGKPELDKRSTNENKEERRVRSAWRSKDSSAKLQTHVHDMPLMHMYQARTIRIRSAHRGIKTNARHTINRTTEGEEQQGKEWATRGPSSALSGAGLVTGRKGP